MFSVRGDSVEVEPCPAFPADPWWDDIHCWAVFMPVSRSFHQAWGLLWYMPICTLGALSVCLQRWGVSKQYQHLLPKFLWTLSVDKITKQRNLCWGLSYVHWVIPWSHHLCPVPTLSQIHTPLSSLSLPEVRSQLLNGSASLLSAMLTFPHCRSVSANWYLSHKLFSGPTAAGRRRSCPLSPWREVTVAWKNRNSGVSPPGGSEARQ
jgi:hypothetical protein